MVFRLYTTVKGQIRCDKYKSIDDLALAYEGVRGRYRPAWAYDDTGALVLGAEPDGFRQPLAAGEQSGLAPA